MYSTGAFLRRKQKTMETGEGHDEEVRCEMYSCLRRPVRLCRWLGSFPVEGLDSADVRALRYNVRSFYGLYSLISFFGHLWLVIMSIIHFFGLPFNVSALSNIVFAAQGLVCSINIHLLAKKWPEFMKKAAKIESRLVEIRTSKRTHIKCTCCCLFIVSITFVELSLFFQFAFYLGKMCADQDELTDEVMEIAFRTRMPVIYETMTYKPWITVIGDAVTFGVTFLWALHDVLPICFSFYLTSYFRDLNKVIYERVDSDASSWNQLRSYYADVVTLLQEINSRMARSLLVSYGIGIYFISTVLFSSLRAFTGPAHDSYYVMTIVVVVLRISILSLSVANVHHEAVKPIVALHSASASAYGLEIQRFHRQITYQKIALSGVFFHITRPLILEVIGLLITFELLLLKAGKSNVRQNVTTGLDKFDNFTSIL